MAAKKLRPRTVEEFALQEACPSCLAAAGKPCVFKRRRSEHPYHLTRMDAGSRAMLRAEQ